jgi:hypothetical protein
MKTAMRLETNRNWPHGIMPCLGHDPVSPSGQEGQRQDTLILLSAACSLERASSYSISKDLFVLFPFINTSIMPYYIDLLFLTIFNLAYRLYQQIVLNRIFSQDMRDEIKGY